MREEGLKLSMATVIPVLSGLELLIFCAVSSVVGAGLVVVWENKKVWKPTHENWANFLISSVVGVYLSSLAVFYLYKKTVDGDNSVVVIAFCCLLGMNGSIVMERAITGFRKYVDVRTAIALYLKSIGLPVSIDKSKLEESQKGGGCDGEDK